MAKATTFIPITLPMFGNISGITNSWIFYDGLALFSPLFIK